MGKYKSKSDMAEQFAMCVSSIHRKDIQEAISRLGRRQKEITPEEVLEFITYTTKEDGEPKEYTLADFFSTPLMSVVGVGTAVFMKRYVLEEIKLAIEAEQHKTAEVG